MKKEMLKKAFAMMVAMLCMLTLATAALAEAADEAPVMAEGADSDWYMDILADESIIAEYPYHAFIDLNGNGVPVLIISTTESDFITSEDKASVYLYIDGGAEDVLDVANGAGDRFFANLDECTLTHYSRMAGAEFIEVYRVEAGGLNLILSADRYEAHHYPEQDTDETVWLKDNEPITEEEGKTLFDLYALDNAITYEALQ